MLKTGLIDQSLLTGLKTVSSAKWDLLITHKILPERSKIEHLLSSLFFMKQYSTEGAGTATVGGPRRNIDPKTKDLVLKMGETICVGHSQ